MILLSVTGLFKTLLIIVGVLVVLRFIGRLSIAKRNLDEQERFRKQQLDADELIEKSKRNFGKTSISRIEDSHLNTGDYVDFEEIDDK